MSPGKAGAESQSKPREDAGTDAARERETLGTPAARTTRTNPDLRTDRPGKLFVEVTTRCNLRCGMCVKQNGEGGISEGSMAPDTFALLEPAFPKLDALILNGIGEPLLHPHLEEFTRKAKNSMPEGSWVGFQTNGMLLNDVRAASLLDAGLDRICLSLDAVSGDGFRTIREGGEMGNMESAFAALNKAKVKSGRHNMMTGIEFVVRRDNMDELPSAVRWAADRGASFAIVTQLLPYNKALVSQAAYDTNTAGAISIYERWKARAEAEGLDIRRYSGIFMKFSRTAEDLKIVRLVEEMKKDAGSQGIFLHLERLFARDEEWLRRVEGIFVEVRRIAEERDIDVTLPGTSPRSSRRCDFVEADSAFVSWDGNVHPCYFLWHRYRCHAGGWEKRVKPWVLGNVHENGIMDIWNGRSCSSFRESVLRYNFPFCSDCGFALCDYVEDEDFQQDCYVGTVPCGACLWCTGLFHCLQ
jgi:putative metalloenzyme radical SAM/SPASM domain maturase